MSRGSIGDCTDHYCTWIRREMENEVNCAYKLPPGLISRAGPQTRGKSINTEKSFSSLSPQLNDQYSTCKNILLYFLPSVLSTIMYIVWCVIREWTSLCDRGYHEVRAAGFVGQIQPEIGTVHPDDSAGIEPFFTLHHFSLTWAFMFFFFPFKRQISDSVPVSVQSIDWLIWFIAEKARQPINESSFSIQWETP